MFSHPPIYNIPQEYDYVIVSDMYASDYPGGAEQTLSSILDKCPGKYIKLYCDQITEKTIASGKDKHWIIGNHSSLSKEMLIELATSGAKYSIVCCDYFYCKYRSSHLHELTLKTPCDCHMTAQGRFILGVYKRAHKVFFMSDGQLNEHKRLFPVMNKWPIDKLIVQGSTFDDESLELLNNLGGKYPFKNGKWAIQGGGNTSWIKNTEGAVNYCKLNKLEYDIIGGLKPKDFLEKLAQYEGLILIPLGFDTAPRISIEARLMSLKLVLNNNVQNKDDKDFNSPIDQLYYSLLDKADNFWRLLEGK